MSRVLEAVDDMSRTQRRLSVRGMQIGNSRTCGLGSSLPSPRQQLNESRRGSVLLSSRHVGPSLRETFYLEQLQRNQWRLRHAMGTIAALHSWRAVTRDCSTQPTIDPEVQLQSRMQHIVTTQNVTHILDDLGNVFECPAAVQEEARARCRNRPSTVDAVVALAAATEEDNNDDFGVTSFEEDTHALPSVLVRPSAEEKLKQSQPIRCATQSQQEREMEEHYVAEEALLNALMSCLEAWQRTIREQQVHHNKMHHQTESIQEDALTFSTSRSKPTLLSRKRI